MEKKTKKVAAKKSTKKVASKKSPREDKPTKADLKRAAKLTEKALFNKGLFLVWDKDSDEGISSIRETNAHEVAMAIINMCGEDIMQVLAAASVIILRRK